MVCIIWQTKAFEKKKKKKKAKRGVLALERIKKKNLYEKRKTHSLSLTTLKGHILLHFNRPLYSDW